MIKGMLVGSVSVTNLSGPVSIAEFSGKAMQSGWVAFLSLLGLLSLSLGILNLLPIPVLDGGHLFFYVIEMIKGAPVKESIEAGAQKVGLMLILGLTFFALFNDVVRISNG
jgi:regulator of sigma E protease